MVTTDTENALRKYDEAVYSFSRFDMYGGSFVVYIFC